VISSLSSRLFTSNSSLVNSSQRLIPCSRLLDPSSRLIASSRLLDCSPFSYLQLSRVSLSLFRLLFLLYHLILPPFIKSYDFFRPYPPGCITHPFLSPRFSSPTEPAAIAFNNPNSDRDHGFKTSLEERNIIHLSTE
jgi:hypothetical protein